MRIYLLEEDDLVPLDLLLSADPSKERNVWI